MIFKKCTGIIPFLGHHRTLVASLHTSTIRRTPTKDHYDVVIVGGGMVGGTLASALGHEKVLSDKSVLLLEGASKFKGFPVDGEFSNRVSTLNSGTIRLLESIGVWDRIESVRANPVYDMQVWDASSSAFITFHKNSEPIAHVVENDLVLDSVYKSLEPLSNVTVKYDSRIENFKLPATEQEKGSVFLKSGEEISFNLLIGADGANSSVRKAMDVDVFSTTYNQMGIVATLALETNSADENNHTAWQRFLPDGPVALLPLNREKSSLVWTTTPENAKRLVQVPAEEFVAELNSALFGKVKQNEGVTSLLKLADSMACTLLGGSNGVSGVKQESTIQSPPAIKSVIDKSRAAFPFGFTHASSYVGTGVALIGDAAHRIHPLAGQEVNLGYGDVSCLVEKIAAAVYNGAEVNTMNYLLEYERERLQKNVPIMMGVHGLQKLYSTEFPPVVLLRSLGLKVTNSVPFIKNLFVNRAMA